MWRGNLCARPSCHASLFPTFVYLHLKLLALIQKRFLIGSPLLGSRNSKFATPSNSPFPFHSSRSSWGEQKTSGSTVPSFPFPVSEFTSRSIPLRPIYVYQWMPFP